MFFRNEFVEKNVSHMFGKVEKWCNLLISRWIYYIEFIQNHTHLWVQHFVASIDPDDIYHTIYFSQTAMHCEKDATV